MAVGEGGICIATGAYYTEGGQHSSWNSIYSGLSTDKGLHTIPKYYRMNTFDHLSIITFPGDPCILTQSIQRQGKHVPVTMIYSNSVFIRTTERYDPIP